MAPQQFCVCVWDVWVYCALSVIVWCVGEARQETCLHSVAAQRLLSPLFTPRQMACPLARPFTAAMRPCKPCLTHPFSFLKQGIMNSSEIEAAAKARVRSCSDASSITPPTALEAALSESIIVGGRLGSEDEALSVIGKFRSILYTATGTSLG